MSILQFKKKESRLNSEMVNELRKLRTEAKQNKLQQNKIIAYLDENVKDSFIFDKNDLPIAKLNISPTTGFDSKLLEEKQPDIYALYPKPGKRRTWTIL